MTIEGTVVEGIGRVTIKNPPLNILTREVMAALRSELKKLASEHSLRVLILCGEGKHFSAGADVGEHLPPDFREMIPEFLDTVAAIDAFPLPVIAPVQGRCLGGGFELVIGADLVIAAETAQFGQPEIMLGVIPPAACALLPDLCSRGMAAEIVYTGDPISAQDAAGAGLVWKVVPDDRLLDEALDAASRIARHSAAALRAAKRSMRATTAITHSAAMAAVGKIYIEELMATEDALEGLNSFLEKRQPTWKHA
jgi:cyclohexa-1,5-dienecarbonyl-CoA hydratase